MSTHCSGGRQHYKSAHHARPLSTTHLEQLMHKGARARLGRAGRAAARVAGRGGAERRRAAVQRGRGRAGQRRPACAAGRRGTCLLLQQVGALVEQVIEKLLRVLHGGRALAQQVVQDLLRVLRGRPAVGAAAGRLGLQCGVVPQTAFSRSSALAPCALACIAKHMREQHPWYRPCRELTAAMTGKVSKQLGGTHVRPPFP